MNTQRQVYSWSQDDKDYDWNVDEGDVRRAVKEEEDQEEQKVKRWTN